MLARRPDDAVLDRQAGHAVEQREVDVLAERQHQRVGLQRLELSPVGCGKPLSSSAIFSTVSVPSSACLIVDSHLIITPSCSASSTSKSCAGIARGCGGRR
jgi:hypothetical protein